MATSDINISLLQPLALLIDEFLRCRRLRLPPHLTAPAPRCQSFVNGKKIKPKPTEATVEDGRG